MRYGKLEDSFMGPAIYTEGEELVNDAWEADSATRRQNLARKALKADLDNIDAYVILGIEAKTHGERIALFREAVRVGDRLWAPFVDDPEMAWWGFMGTRPWMRAMQNLGLALDQAGDIDEAEEVYRRLLTLNPNDNQGIRALLTGIYMEKPRVGALRSLLKQYPDDMMIESVMARLWLDLRRKNADMGALGPAVDERNRHVLPMLAGHLPDAVKRSPFGVTVGGADEAEEYVANFGPIWEKSAKAMAAIRAYAAGNRAAPRGA